MQQLPRYDCHVHTTNSPCGEQDMTLENILAEARRLGLKGLCLTDHMHPDTDPDSFGRLRAELANADVGDLRVWIGCEADVLAPGRWSLTNEQASTMDVVLVAPYHAIDCIQRPTGEAESDAVDYLLQMMHAALDCPGVDIIVHPLWFQSGGRYDVTAVIRTVLKSRAMTEFLRRAVHDNVAVELSRRLLTDPYLALVKPFYQRCLDLGIKIALGSDAHAPAMMDVWEVLDAFLSRLGADYDTCLYLPDEATVAPR